jgi:hypothetical protein
VAIDDHRIGYFGAAHRDTTRSTSAAGTHTSHTYATAGVVGGPDRYRTLVHHPPSLGSKAFRTGSLGRSWSSRFTNGHEPGLAVPSGCGKPGGDLDFACSLV